MRKSKGARKASQTSIGQRLRMMRLARGLTLRQVEQSTGIGVSHLSQIENNLRNVNVAKLQALANCLGCSVADFFPRSGDPEPEFLRAKPLTPTQRGVLKAMEDKAMARHLLEQARMKVKYKATLARRRHEKRQ